MGQGKEIVAALAIALTAFVAIKFGLLGLLLFPIVFWQIGWIVSTGTLLTIKQLNLFRMTPLVNSLELYMLENMRLRIHRVPVLPTLTSLHLFSCEYSIRGHRSAFTHSQMGTVGCGSAIGSSDPSNLMETCFESK